MPFFDGPKNVMITFVVAYVTLVVMNVLTIQWVVYGDNKERQRWCDTIVIINDKYSDTDLTKLERDFHCR